jgi:O-antigen ligase
MASNVRRLISSIRANPAVGRVAGVSLAVLGFVGLTIVGFNLAMMPVGCQVLWGFLAAACGTKLGIAGAVVLFVAPIALIYFVKRPWIFPISIFALLVQSDLYLAVTSGGTLTKFAGILSAAAILLYLAREKRFVIPGKATAAWVAYFVFASLTQLWAQNNDSSTLAIWSTLFQLVMFYVLLSIMPIEERDFKFVLGAYIAGCMLASLFGAYVFAHASASGLTNTMNLNQGRLHAHFGGDNKLDSDVFSSSFVFPMALMVINVLRTRWGLKKILFMCAFAVMLIGQLVVASRGGLLADCVMLSYLFWKTRYRAQLSFVAITGVLVSLIYPTAVWSRFLTPDETGGSGRLEIWKVGFAALKQYWLFGAGFDNFNYVFDHYFLSVWNSFNPQWHRAPHNIVLEAAVDLGIAGLAILLIAWWTTAKSFAHIGKDDPLYDYRIAIEAGILGSFVAGLFVGIMVEKWTWWEFAIVALWRQVSLSRPPAGPAEPTIVHLADEPPQQRALERAGRAG